MKRKNLEKAIVLGLMLGCVYSTALAEELPKATLYTDNNLTLTVPKGSFTTEQPSGVWNPYNTSAKNTDLNNVNISANIEISGTYSGRPAITAFQANGDGNILNVEQNAYLNIETTSADNFQVGTFLSWFNMNGVYASNGATINLNGDVYLRAVNLDNDEDINSNILHTDANPSPIPGSVININKANDSKKTIQLIGGFKSEGDAITVNLANINSYWYGVVNTISNIGGAGLGSDSKTVTVGLSNGAKWVPINYSAGKDSSSAEIGTLNLNNGGIVDISKYNMDDAPEEAIVEGVATGADRTAATNHEVSVTNLKGSNGLFKMDLNYLDENGAVYTGNKGDNDVSDYLDIKTGGEGTQYIDFNAKDANIDKMNVGDKIYFANVASGDTQFDSTQHVYSSAANINNYEYGVESETGSGTDWYVTLNNKTPDGNGNFEAAKGAMYAGYALGTELDRLNKRMGEARYLEDEKGVWVRYRHAKTGWDDTFETSSDMFQLGYDKEVQEDDGKHYRGIALDYTDADTTLDNVSGDGEHERYAVSLYDTWLGEKGHYRDLVIRGGRINSDYDLHGMFNDGMYDIGGDYHQWFGSISAEWGRKNDMNDGWYFEPQTQLQLARVGGASYVSDSGIAVDQDGATSLIGRVGFRLGREYAKADGTKHDNYYIKADLLHEFMGDKGIALTGADGRYEHEYDGQETWFDVGLGADISIDKNTYFWVDVEKTLGSDFDNTWQVNGGFRWEF